MDHNQILLDALVIDQLFSISVGSKGKNPMNFIIDGANGSRSAQEISTGDFRCEFIGGIFDTTISKHFNFPFT